MPKPERKKKGRPTTYKVAFVKQATKLCELGATDDEIADFFDVDVRTIYRWKNKYNDFCQALKAGKQEADERVERSLYQKAVGYEVDDLKIFMPGGSDKPVFAPYVKRVAPDTVAAIFWLKNRRPDRWREKQEVEHEIKGEIHVYGVKDIRAHKKADA